MSFTKTEVGSRTSTDYRCHTAAASAGGGASSDLHEPQQQSDRHKTLFGATLDLPFTRSDTVSKLYIDGVLQSAGTWGSPASSATYKTSLISGSGTITAGSGATQPPFASYMAAAGVTGASAAAGAEPAGDGVPNGLKYILGGSPNTPGTSLLPRETVTSMQVQLSFLRNGASESTTTLYTEWSLDLINWNSVPVGATSTTTTQGIGDEERHRAGFHRGDLPSQSWHQRQPVYPLARDHAVIAGIVMTVNASTPKRTPFTGRKAKITRGS